MIDRITKSGTALREKKLVKWSIVEQVDGKYRIDLSWANGFGARGAFDTEAEAIASVDDAIARNFQSSVTETI